jgi:hypothetical protein
MFNSQVPGGPTPLRRANLRGEVKRKKYELPTAFFFFICYSRRNHYYLSFFIYFVTNEHTQIALVCLQR